MFNKWKMWRGIFFTLQHNVSQEDIIRGCREQRMKDLVFDIAGNANVHLETVSD